MALREELARQGTWLFRWRSYVPLVPLAVILADLPSGRDPRAAAWNPWWEMFCVAVSLGGLAVRAHAVGHAAKGTSGRNTRRQKAARLNTSGLYSVVRHPLYLGNFLMWAGVALFPRMWMAAVAVALFFWVYYERIMYTEEEYLRGEYGTEYTSWADHTPAFLPRLRRWRAPELSFSLRAVLSNEYASFLGLAASFTVLKLAVDLVFRGRLHSHPFWFALFGAGVLGYVVLRTLRKRTRLLKVEREPA